MAVFTEVSSDQLANLLQRYFGQYQLTRFEGITAGIENSNFYVDLISPEGPTEWVLTVFEMPDVAALPLIIELTQQLAGSGLPVPAAVNDCQGRSIQEVAGKPCVLVPRVTGQHSNLPSVEECQQIGSFLGKMHLTSRTFAMAKQQSRDLRWLQRCQKILCSPRRGLPSATQDCQLTAVDRAVLTAEINHAGELATEYECCPRGWVHGDLFVDNALFDRGQITGIIDFYHACHDVLINDLAIACNDWCYRLGQGYVPTLVNALLDGYQQQRPLTPQEKKYWPDALRLGALRFWLSRLLSIHSDSYQKSVKHGQVFKNPEEKKEKILAARKVKALT